jgi:glutamine synthetase
LKALAELEFYITARQQTELLFAGASDRNYHDSSPFSKFEDIRNEILSTLEKMGISTKYGHSEVGRIIDGNATITEQHEIEFTPQTLTDMAETVAVAKWVVRNVCMKHGVSVSFIPKIDLNHAGSGMHIHLCGLNHGRNVTAKKDGSLSNDSLRMIGGILKFAPSLAAFGNPTPVSYLRFIARKESPMHICWSARNRLALIRIPLWWKFKKGTRNSKSCRETFEYRAPDAFANPYLLFAGLTLAAEYGLENPVESLTIANDLYAESVQKEEKRFRLLPRSCSEAAKNLAKNRKYYEERGVFPTRLVDGTIETLEGYNDQYLWKELLGKPEELRKMLMEYIDYG